MQLKPAIIKQWLPRYAVVHTVINNLGIPMHAQRSDFISIFQTPFVYLQNVYAGDKITVLTISWYYNNCLNSGYQC